MKVVLVALSALLALAACGSDDGDSVAEDPAPSASASASPPTAPVPAGEVRTATLATVMDDPGTDGPELCLGPIAESYPPMCSGPPLLDWDWSQIGQGMHETQGETRWGSYALTGTWDGTAFTAVSAIPAALYDAAPVAEDTPGPAAGDCAGTQRIATDLGELPYAVGAAALDCTVLLDVTYDDGSVQAWADATYGDGVVRVSSALVDVTG